MIKKFHPDDAESPTVISVKIGSWENSFWLVETNAPKVYDYGYVIEVTSGEYEGKLTRYVLIPDSRLQYQTGRYGSGNHYSKLSDMIPSGDIQEFLYDRIMGRPPL